MKNRRTFIKEIALGTSGVLLSQNAFPNIIVNRTKDKIGVALLGLGYYSKHLLAPALQLTRHCELKGIVTGTPSKVAEWQTEYGIADKNVYSYDSLDEIANNPDIDVVYVVVPPFRHKEFTVRLANLGKHVWCEKPMAMTEAECQVMIDECQKNKVQLTIGYRMQHEPNTRELIRMGKEQVFGGVKFVTANAGFRSSWKGWEDHWKMEKSKGGGALYDMGVYSLNAARYATSEEPVAVMAQELTDEPMRFSRADETTMFQLEFPSGALANCMTSLGMNINELTVNAEKGWYRLEPFQSYSGVKGRTSKGTLIDLYIENQQATQMDNDALAIMNGTAVRVPGIEGLKDIRVVDAIHQSVKQGKRIVI